MSSVTIEGLSKRFWAKRGKPPTTAIDNLDLEVGEGELVVFLGPSGCGKTTTLRCVAGLERPESGRILFGDRVVVDAAVERFEPPNKREVGMVFQSFALWPNRTVRENIAFPLRARRMRSALSEGWVDEAARLIECESLLDRYPSQLSGGQQQRIALARALVARPRVILFDEPLSNLDAKLRVSLRHEIYEMHKKLGFTGIYVTHDQEEAMALADRIVVMRDGQIEQVGTPEDVFRTPATEYVADFIGENNVVRAKAAETDWQHGDLRADWPNPREVLADSLTFRFRSSVARLGVVGTGVSEDVTFRGFTVTDVTFGGTYRDVTLQCDDIRISSRLEADVPAPRVGDAAEVRVDRRRVHLFDPEGCAVSVTAPTQERVAL